jgi:hypothetical protein
LSGDLQTYYIVTVITQLPFKTQNGLNSQSSILGSFQCRLGWQDSGSFTESSFESKGLVYKNVMAKTRKEKGKEAELHVSFQFLEYLCKQL